MKPFIGEDVSFLGTSISFNSLTEESNRENHQILVRFEHQNLPTTPLSERASDSVDEGFTLQPSTVDPNSEPLVAVIGVGYVGEHLVESFSAHYNVIAFDVSPERIADIEQKYSDCSRVTPTTRASALREATHFLISVPTLLRPDKTIDSSYLRSAVNTVATYGRPGSTVVVESSVAVGMTRSILGPIGFARHFFIGMSPEVGFPCPFQPISLTGSLACRPRPSIASDAIYPKGHLRPR
jgi:hypothetical protein